MTNKIRRVITGHDKDGKAICISDNIATEILQRDSRPGQRILPGISGAWHFP